MELWIRSQDKESLIPVNERIFMLDLHNGRNIEIKCGAYNILGIYKTEERALEVLDEIQEYITPTLSLLDDTLRGKQICQVNNILSMVYEMPKE